MARLSRFAIMDQKKNLIKKFFSKQGKRVFSVKDIYNILDENREIWDLAVVTKGTDFIKFLTENKILEKMVIKIPHREITKFYLSDVSTYEIALSINKNSYLSHYTAVFLHGLTNNIPKTLYTNTEQYEKYRSDEKIIQKNIDWAFSRTMRSTNQVARYTLNDTSYQVYLVNGKQQNGRGVTTINLNGVHLPVTDIERTLIDIVVRPNYSGGLQEILCAFKTAKGLFSVNRLLAMLTKMDFAYPYHQAIGFYLEKAGYDENILKLVERKGISYKFYLTYQIKEKSFSNRWGLFYPKYLDD